MPRNVCAYLTYGNHNISFCVLLKLSQTINSSALSRSRKKIPWQLLRDIVEDAVELAYKL